MLLHLADSIKRLGPAILFATQKFESYNGVTCKASIHSNHEPGQDVAQTFNNERLFCILMSGSVFFDQDLQAHLQAGPKDLELSQNSKKGSATPPELKRQFPKYKWNPVESVVLRKHQKVKAGTWVAFQGESYPVGASGCGVSVWRGTKKEEKVQSIH
ncbi:hypothetical protein DFH28DRAFT_935875 [Melampsora americana]|nr:hypothetical protein DFH28DRAFT_935875 [Melampsora americana]